MNIYILLLIIIITLYCSSNNYVFESFGAKSLLKNANPKNINNKLNPIKQIEAWIKKMGYYMILIISCLCCPCMIGVILYLMILFKKR